uniref:protein xylosyltransferase n=1 Tax=Anopheles culicifacies TaxID=139723 RepID=A0A182LT57_9DIPT
MEQCVNVLNPEDPALVQTYTDDAAECLSKLLEDLRIPLQGFFASAPEDGSSIRAITISNGTTYELPCQLSEPRAIDAITRAISDECKIKIAKAACKNAQGKLTPRSIEHQCPRGEYFPLRLLGCYPIQNMIYNITMKVTPDNTPKSCVYFCTQRNFRYAMVQNGELCFCKDEKPDPTDRLPSSECKVACSGNPALLCGGSLEALVYETGLAKHPELPLKLYPSPTDKPVRIAFLLMFHKRNLRQVHRLIRNIYDKTHYYYIHVDPKQHYLYRELLKLEKDYPNIYIARQRHTVVWGCFTQLQAMLASMKDIMTKPSWDPDFILNMSESDFPAQTIAKLTQFLTANRGRNFLQIQGIVTVDQFITESGYDHNFLECDNRMWCIGNRKVPDGIITNGGSDWFCLSRDFIRYALDERHDQVADLMHLMEHTSFCTESFFQQLLQNSAFCRTHYNSGLRIVSWTKGHGCTKGREIEWTGCSPLTIRRESWPDILNIISDDIYAIRKFNPIFDQSVILTLEEYVFGKYPSDVPNLNAFWENVYHHEDEKHNPRMNAVLNVAYVLLAINAQHNEYERYEVLKILEITHHFYRNAFDGFLIRHTALLNDRQVELEVFVMPTNMFKLNRIIEAKLSKVLLEITNTIEVVESRPLDFDKVFTVDKQPILIFELPRDRIESNTKIHHNISVDWIDPHQQTVAVENFTIVEDPNKMNHHPLRCTTLNLPLDEGVWRAKVALNGTYIGQVDFIVVSNVPIARPRYGTNTNVCDRPRVLFENMVCNKRNSDQVLHKNAHLSESVKRLFHIENTCIVDENIPLYHLNSKPFVNCSATLWSTLAPDPKSDVHYRVKKNK